MAERRAELLQDMVEQTKTFLSDFGVAEPVAEQAAAGLADYLAEHWGGQVISIPKDQAYKLAARDREVVEAARTMSIAGLAARFGICERAIRRLLKRASARATLDSQLDLF
ncbi:Mor transcription activator family protein [Tahibacter sp.]|uniref:Mor transcription activator family protein n=1 Tax=Tahibacter sp. TaxID=2056211 RepID=UPI002D80F128|nr:Mor transcription activator family protein [Tahibacter sp.]